MQSLNVSLRSTSPTSNEAFLAHDVRSGLGRTTKGKLSSKGNGGVRSSVDGYLRQLGDAQLLTRDGEVELAERIEQGEAVMFRALLHTRLASGALVRLMDQLREDDIRMSEVLRDGDDENEYARSHLVQQLEAFADLQAQRERLSVDAHRTEAFALIHNEMATLFEGVRWSRDQLDRFALHVSDLVQQLEESERTILACERRASMPAKEILAVAEGMSDEADEGCVVGRRGLRKEELHSLRESIRFAEARMGEAKDKLGLHDITRTDFTREFETGRRIAEQSKAKLVQSQPATGGQPCQEVPPTRRGLPRPGTGRQHWAHEGGRQV